ncbi:hypothetical protein [Geobacter sp. SVR]|uniref:hypothetical protein n=1 Tax=Geobacter sp. SVR TaxID=2495594 RepID=UPI00143EF6D2|nr:hypothetical protein [Geobacter sp. SVR]BCS55214.1 hypothetical protein GSVR_35220 [Geobacter sp. SVR]GCF86015.1 hypothetical protein GSbR_26150 [Geobacter sp. SVR]
MGRRMTEATTTDYQELLAMIREIHGGLNVQEMAQQFVDVLYGRFSDTLVLLRLFVTLPYSQLPLEDQQFVDRKGWDTNTFHQINAATPIFTLLGTQGARPEWNNRMSSTFFRCIPLVSTAFISSLSMLSQQFKSVGLDLGLIDAWNTRFTAEGRADQYRGMLYIREAGVDRDTLGRLIVPKQEFVNANHVKTTLGFGCGYTGHASLLTLFAFTNEILERPVVEPIASLLETFRDLTEESIRKGRLFPVR